MTRATGHSAFGWRARGVRALLVFGLALVSVFAIECESIVVISFGEWWRLRELRADDPGAWKLYASLREAALDRSFWILYALIGLPLAALHATASLAWHPAVPWLRAHVWLTVVAGLAMLTASFADPLFAFVLAVLCLCVAHLPCIAGPTVER